MDLRALHHNWMMGEAGEAALKDTASLKDSLRIAHKEAREARETNIFQQVEKFMQVNIIPWVCNADLRSDFDREIKDSFSLIFPNLFGSKLYSITDLA